MIPMRRLAILIAYGPEARAFVQSGLAERLAERHELVFAASRVDSPALSALPGELAPAPEGVEPPTLCRLRRLRARLQPTGAPGLAVQAVEAFALRAWGGSAGWRDWFSRHRIDLTLSGSYSSARTLPALAAAARAGLPSVVLANSWKDVHQRPHCAPPLAGLGVFAESERRRFLAANPSFPASNLRSIGSLHCAALLRNEPLSRAELADRLGLDPQRPFVCFIAARDGAAEQPLIRRLLARLRRLEPQPQLVVRLNPMDAADWAADWAGEPDVVFDRPCWSWDPQREWICPLPSDAPSWAGLLSQAAAVVSRPSTAAWEAATLKRRLLTIAWGDAQPAWDAPDFRHARACGWVRGIFSEDSLAAALAEEIASPQPPAVAPPADPVERACAVVETALHRTSFVEPVRARPLGEAAP